MATYKLIQDIEAEDHILGPLTLRQFIFALITAFLLYINFFLFTKGAAFLMVLFLPPALLTGFFAFPFGRDQPTEVWALAKLRFLFKSRKRIWNQSGVKNLVTITAPKRVEQVYTDGLSQSEVKSRLQVLANTIDSRGWAVKNANLNSFQVPNPLTANESDRLISVNDIPQAVPDSTITAGDDILDEQHNPIARQFDAMIVQSEQARRQEIVNTLNNPSPAATVNDAAWFMPSVASPATEQPIVSGPVIPEAAAETPDETALGAKLHAQHDTKPAAYGNLRTLQPLSNQPQPTAPATAVPAATGQPQPQTAAPALDPAVMALANNDDLNVATIARQANKNKSEDGEVTISLH